MKIGFIGLGVMGYPMAGHLAKAGHDVSVYNRTRAKAEQWCNEHRGCLAETPHHVAADAQLVMICVGDDPDVRAVVEGDDGLLVGMRQGGVIVDHTTTSAELPREMSRLAQRHGLQWIDAPVSGGQAGAENAALTIMAGGEANAFDRAYPAMECYSRRCRLMGESGAGALTKMVNQICLAGLIQGLSEALAFAQRSGLDGQAVVDVISGGAAQSWQMDNRAASMLADQFDFGFAVEWMRKDLGHALSQARKVQASLPVTALVDQFYADLMRDEGNRLDTSSLIRRLS